jgi:DNA modification methylase
MSIRIIHGDCRNELISLPDQSVHCCVTSPPYYGLRDYGVMGQIGLEPTPQAFVEEMVNVFREVRRVLSDDGTLWLNLGDSYSNGGRTTQIAPTLRTATFDAASGKQAYLANFAVRPKGDSWSKPKDLLGIPWRVAFALQADGWYLRQDIIWSKPNPMPESVTDRCTKAHEYIFLLSKRPQYYYNQEAILEPLALTSVKRLSQQTLDKQQGSDRVPGKTNGTIKAVSRQRKQGEPGRHGLFGAASCNISNVGEGCVNRNKRSVWEVTTKPFSDAHFATFPPALIEPCILAGCPKGGTVLDPFAGAGTTGLVADRLQRNAILIELNPDYIKMAQQRIHDDAPLLVTL